MSVGRGGGGRVLSPPARGTGSARLPVVLGVLILLILPTAVGANATSGRKVATGFTAHVGASSRGTGIIGGPGDLEVPSHRGVLVPVGRTAIHGLAPPTSQVPAPGWVDRLHLGAVPLPPRIGTGKPAPVVDGSFSISPAGPSQLLNGSGFQGIDNSQCGCTPPDVQDAAGPYEVVEMVNTYVEVWSKHGTALGGEPLSTFYSTSGFLSDPRIIYDNLSGRFFTSILTATSTTGSVYFAVSDNSSAAGNWTVYKILSAGAALPDQPIIGVNATLIGIGVNIFSSKFNGAAEYWVINKSAALQGLTPAYVAFGPDATAFSVHPDRTIDPTAPLYFVESLPGAPGTLGVFRVAGAPPGTTTIARTNLSIGTLTSPPPAPTPGGGYVDSGSFRVADAIERSGRLYVTFGDQCVVGGANRSCVRMDVVNTTPSLAVDQDLDVARSGMYLYYPALSLDAVGNAVLVFGVSSANLYPSVAGTTHRAADPSGTYAPFVWLHRGTAGFPGSCSPSCRFGDYFGSGLDPNSSTVWVSGEYLTNTTMWQSWLAPVQSAGPTQVLLTSPAVGDVGRPLNVTLNVTPAPCGPGWADWCTADVPLENGSVFQMACGSLAGPLEIPDQFALAGSFPIGTGGNVSVYNDSRCSLGNRTEVFLLNATSVTVFRAPSVALGDSNGGEGDVGQFVQFTASAHFGDGPFSFRWTGLPPGCLAANSTKITCTPTTPGPYPIRVAATDVGGDTVTAASSYQVDPDPVYWLNTSATRADVGMGLTLTGGASGGSGSYSFQWGDLPPGCTPLTDSSQQCILSASGSFQITLGGNDSAGFPALSPVVDVEVAAALTVEIVATPATLRSGVPTLLQATVIGGFEPVSFQWSGLPSSCAAGPAPNITCAFPAGSYRVNVTVEDAVGGVDTAIWAASTPPTPAASTDSSQILYLGIGSVVLLLAVAAGIVLLRSRRRGRNPP